MLYSAVLILSFSTSFASASISDNDIQSNSSELFKEFLTKAKSKPSSTIGRRRRAPPGTYDFNGVPVAERCESFVGGDEALGSNGVLTQQELTQNTKDYSRLMSSSALGDVCPNYPNLNADSRGFIWAVILTAVANFESSCDGSQTAAGPNGTARGLFQLHQGHEAGYDNENECIKNASYSEENSIKCALGMLDLQLQKEGKLFSNKSYWEVLRPNGNSQRADDIERALSNSSFCKID